MKKANIKDVAKAAGVAVSTVSRVLNDHIDVNKETKKHVLQVMKELNYVPNNSARNLKRTNSTAIGIFVLGEYNPFFGEIVANLECEISRYKYSAIIHFHKEESNSTEAAAEFILEKKLLGLICLGGIVSKKEEGYLQRLEAPVVFTSSIIDKDVNKELFSSISIDENKAVNEIINHIITLGHKKIGIITAAKKNTCVSKQRFESFLNVLKSNSLPFNKKAVECGNYSIKSGYESMTKIIEKKTGITALFAVNDMMAIGAAKAAIDKGFRVPEDISIVGFDGLEYGQYFNPALTTIKQPGSLFGEVSVKVLIDKIENESKTEHIILDTELIKRDSCCSLK